MSFKDLVESTNSFILLVTNIAVLIGLYLLIVEIRQTTVAIDNETDAVVYSLSTQRRLILIENQEAAKLLVRAPKTAWSEFSELEKIQLDGYWGPAVDGAALQFRMYRRKGELPDNIVFPEHYFGYQSFRTWWKLRRWLYEGEFTKFLDKMMARVVSEGREREEEEVRIDDA